MKYGGTGYAAINPSTGQKNQVQSSEDVVFLIDWPIEERIYIESNGDIFFRTLAWHHDLIDHGVIGDAGWLGDWWDRKPVTKARYVAEGVEPRFYQDVYGKWWRQSVGCDFTKCGPNGEGAWCCRNTMRDWPFRVDKEPALAPCVMLQEDRTCALHKEHNAKPIQCVMSPCPPDIMWYVKNGKCTVRWEPVEMPE